MTNGAAILIVDDDQKMIRVYTASLESEGHRVLDAGTGQGGLTEVRTRDPDLVILDLGLPDADGLAVVPRLRTCTDAPIIVVSARAHESDKVQALDAGASDYLTKPFSVPELLARIQVGIRSRAQVGDTLETIVAFGDFRLDLQARRLARGEHQVRLSGTELELLVALGRHADEVVTPNTLLKEAWGAGYQTRSGYVRVYMHALRRKLEDDPTRPAYPLNEAGLGYRLRTSGARRSPR